MLSLVSSWNWLVDLIVVLFKKLLVNWLLALFQAVDNIGQFIKVVKTGDLIEGNGNVVLVNLSKVDAELVEFGKNEIWTLQS